MIRAALVALALLLVPCAATAESLTTPLCVAADALALGDALDGTSSPCVTPPGTLSIDVFYLQNASRVGGTALAAYPFFRLRTGLARRVDVVLDAPSQIAESGLAGRGLYPVTHFGIGIDYDVTSTTRSALAILAEATPPTSVFAPAQTQPRFALGSTFAYLVVPRLTIGAQVGGVSSGSVGFARVLPSLYLTSAFNASSTTQIGADLGTRIVSRRAVAQSLGDISVKHKLERNLTFDAGVGTTFNPVNNEKTHYLASGFNIRL